MNKYTNRRTNRFPQNSTGHHPLRGRCPKKGNEGKRKREEGKVEKRKRKEGKEGNKR